MGERENAVGRIVPPPPHDPPAPGEVPETEQPAAIAEDAGRRTQGMGGPIVDAVRVHGGREPGRSGASDPAEDEDECPRDRR